MTFNSFDKRRARRLKWLHKRLFAKTFWQDWFQPITENIIEHFFWIQKINPLISSPKLDQHKFHHICPVHHPSSLPLPPAGMHTSLLSWPAALHYHLGSTVVLKASIQPALPSTSHDSPLVLAHGLTWKWCWKPASKLAWRLNDVEGPLCIRPKLVLKASLPASRQDSRANHQWPLDTSFLCFFTRKTILPLRPDNRSGDIWGSEHVVLRTWRPARWGKDKSRGPGT